MRLLVADDEAPARERLRRLVEDIDGWEVAGEAANGEDVLHQCAEREPDVVLLDIRMPGMDGLEAARHLTAFDRPPAVIFTTAYSEFALEAFATHVVDYLLKPVQRERLEAALNGAHRITRAQANALQSDAEAKGQERTHLVSTGRGSLTLVPVDDVIYLRAEHKYVCVGYRDGEALIEESLKALEEEFAQRLLRIHRNALVAVDHLMGLEKDADGRCRVVLAGTDTRLEVSRRHVSALRRRLRAAGLPVKS